MSPIDVSARFEVKRPSAPHAATRPLDAAALILVDRSTRTPKILFGRRNPSLRFMPGKFVFPGGRLDPQDRRMAVYGMLDSDSERRLMARVTRPSANRARALALAAIREVCEETGLILGTREAGAPERTPNGWDAFAQAGVFPNLEDLTFVARAVTPPGLPRRFDTRFFMADARSVAHRLDGVVGPECELVETAWMSVSEARQADIPQITRAIIEDVESRLTSGSKPWMPVPYFFARGGRMYRDAIA